MPPLFIILFISFFFFSCRSYEDDKLIVPSEKITASIYREVFDEVLIAGSDTTIPDTIKKYSGIIFQKKETISSAPGTKSVLFNSNGSRLYAMNLEGMSVYEFSQSTKKILREFKFTPTRGTGWDYEKQKPIPSYQEKPVEACFTNHDKILWVSLHNAGGIVPILVDSFALYPQKKNFVSVKHITVINTDSSAFNSFDVPLIKTGKTPKIISKTADDKNLLVSNWHSHTVSILLIQPQVYPYATLIKNIPVSAIPRGIAVDNTNQHSYVAIMGGASIVAINNQGWQKENELPVASNPRHIVTDTLGHLFVSYNNLAKIACIDITSGKTLFTAATQEQPRTIALSKNQQYLFVTCYNGNSLDIFKINDNSFKKIYSLDCPGKPVGVDIYEDDNKMEAWVCSYTNGAINIFTFTKKP